MDARSDPASTLTPLCGLCLRTRRFYRVSFRNMERKAVKGLLSPVRSAGTRIHAWLPTTVDRRVRVIAWLSLLAQIGIVGTGGAVRLTGSGLGCPTWPRCTADSFVNTPEMGIHGVIEFGNRLLTFVLAIIAILAFLYVLRLRRDRPELFRLTLVIGAGIPAQAVLGGITVHTGLNPYVVGAHFVVSIVLIVLSTVLVYRVYFGPSSRVPMVPAWFANTAIVAAMFVAITIVVGILTTGSGPHAGDAGTPRNGLDPSVLQHFHSYPGYVTLGLTLVLLVGSARLRLGLTQRLVGALLAVELVQIGVGVAQARAGLPEILVGIHMVLACVLVAAMTAVVLSLSQTLSPVVEHSPTEHERSRL
jgi:cytochrome c oxidase assembly protein subunit 15